MAPGAAKAFEREGWERETAVGMAPVAKAAQGAAQSLFVTLIWLMISLP